MSLDILFGSSVQTDLLRNSCAADQWTAFGMNSSFQLKTDVERSWQEIVELLPQNWRPEFLVLALPAIVPGWVWTVPMPIIAVAEDLQRHWHASRCYVPYCDLLLADVAPESFARFKRGPRPVQRGDKAVVPTESEARDIDVLYLAESGGGATWLPQLARLTERWRVHVQLQPSSNSGALTELLRRCRVLFLPGGTRELHGCAAQAAWAGALPFVEADVRGVRLRHEQDCALWSAAHWEASLVHWLTHDEDRRRIVAAAQSSFAEYDADSWRRELEALLDGMPRQRAQLGAPDARQVLLARAWLLQGGASDPRLVHDLSLASAQQPADAALHNALGLVVAAGGAGDATSNSAAEHFLRAVQCDASHLLARLNLAEVLLRLHKDKDAEAHARHALAQLDGGAAIDPIVFAGAHVSAQDGLLNREWQRAAWTNAGDLAAEYEAKRRLLRWRLNLILAELTRQLPRHYEAVLARPDLPLSQAALGCALGRAGHADAALGHLRLAVSADPLDVQAAQALYHALGDVGEVQAQRRLARDRRSLARMAPQYVPVEAWFRDAAPVGDELVSIIIPCCNQLDCTQLCLESVARYSRGPYELILIDNGSTDETPSYLEQFGKNSGSRPGLDRFIVLRNETNRGYPAAINQGLAQARGQFFVLLNNDTVVTEDWLQGLVDWTLRDWPRVGLVGAVSNYVPEPQFVPVPYQNLDGLPAFAAQRRRQFKGQALSVERVSGFCLAARREIFDQIGGLDERYGLGFFDDDDLGLRVLECGYQILVALDIFIHHFGSKTYKSIGIDPQQLLRENFERFKAKWGERHAARYRFPEPPPQQEPAALVETVPAEPRRQTVSLCIIARDEEANLPACLQSVADLVDERIVVDTGSKDRTKEIASGFGCAVHDFPWVDSFAAARNESLRHAKGDFIFWMDADDRLDEANRAKLREQLANLPNANVAYVMKCLCLPDERHGLATEVDHVRLFRNDPRIRWKYRIHEQILLAVRATEGEVRWSDVVIHHTGYQPADSRPRKLQRDLRLLNLEQTENPDDPFVLFNLGWTYQELGRPRDAIPLLRRSLDRSHPDDSIVRKLFALLVDSHRQLGDRQEALKICRSGRRHYPADVELLFEEGELLVQMGDLAAAEACLVHLTEGPRDAYFASVDPSVRGYRAQHLLGIIAQRQGRLAEAERHWRQALQERPDLAPAWLELGEMYLEGKRWQDAGACAERLAPLPGRALDAAMLRGRVQLGQGEFGAAAQAMRETTARFPNAIGPRILLSYALLQDGGDPTCAQQALRDVLALDPANAEAQRNLERLSAEIARNDHKTD